MAITKQQLDKDKELLLKSALPIGTLLQSKSRKYYVVEVLGGGGFGITYKVYANEMIGNISQKIFFFIIHSAKIVFFGEKLLSLPHILI